MTLNIGLNQPSMILTDSAMKTKETLIQLHSKHLDLDPGKFKSSKIVSNIFFVCRQCLGKNLYVIETKVMLIHLLRNFSLKPFGDMPKEMVWDPQGLIGKEKIDVKIERRNI